MKAEAKRFNAVYCGRRYGKTVTGIDLAGETAMYRQPVGWFAPEYKLLTEAFRDMIRLYEPVIAKKDVQGKRLEFIGGGVIECWAFDRNPRAGRSRKYARVIIDEAAHCDNLRPVWEEALRPTLADFRGDAWFLSSPKGGSYFNELCKAAPHKPGWAAHHRTTYDNPYIHRAEIDAAREELPDWIFRQEYLAELIEQSHDALLEGSWLDRAASDSIAEAVGDLRAKGQAGRPRMAIDLGVGSGRDSTAILVRDQLGVLHFERSPHVGLPGAAVRVAHLTRDYGIDEHAIVYDAGGPGRDFARHLEQHNLRATPYFGSGSAGIRFKNQRSACAWKLRQRLDPERPLPLRPAEESDSPWKAPTPSRSELQPPFHIPRQFLSSQVREELLGLRYELKGGQIALEPKEDFAERIRRSPDAADTYIMSFFVSA